MPDTDDDAARDMRDIRVMWRTVVTVSVVVAACIGAIVYAATEWTRLQTRLEAVEKWQAAKDREASRALWRQFQGGGGSQLKGIETR